MWTPDLPADGYEARKCRYRVISLCRGRGLDLSAAKEKITRDAIGIGPPGSAADIHLDLTANDALGMFGSDYFDYVFDSHQLGHFKAIDAVLREWWRVVRPGGYLILYEQDRDFYPHVGTPGASPSRRADLIWQDAWHILRRLGNAEMIDASRHNEANEYAWQLVVRKNFGRTDRPADILFEPSKDGQQVFPRKKIGNKEALVIRYGAFGDSVWVSPVVRELKQHGYYVVVNCKDNTAQILKNNPNIDEFIVHESSHSIPYDELPNYWDEISKGFDKVINLTQSIEGVLVKCQGSDEYDWPHEKRHAECNVNFVDRTMECAGYPEIKGAKTELFFTDIEEQLAKTFMLARRDRFVLLWALSGSGFHKTYPWAEYVAAEFGATHKKDAQIITTGDESCRILEWQNPWTINKAGIWTLRQACIMTKYADLVVGPDTGLLNAAGCFDTPKIVMLSSASEENLTKYWENCTVLRAEDCECQPCHRLIYTNECPKGTIAGVAAKCAEHIKPEAVLEAIEKVYRHWQAVRAKELNASRVAAFTIADDDLTQRLARRVRASFAKFHPEVPFYIYNPADEALILDEVRESACACKAFEIRPRLCERLLRDYDCVIYLDADTVVCDRLDEFLRQDYDVAGSLNLGDERYLNAGVSAITSREFCDEWTDLMYKPNGGKSNQVHFNNLAFSGRYRLKIVDESDVYYNERSRPHWKTLSVGEDGKFYCNGRLVKVLHWAGGISRMQDKLSSADFGDDVRRVLDAWTRTKDFTEIKGKEVSQWKL